MIWFSIELVVAAQCVYVLIALAKNRVDMIHVVLLTATHLDYKDIQQS
jgi:hypothetical protein